MKALLLTWFVVAGVALCSELPAIAQTAAGALAINSRQGSQWGWAVDYETSGAAREAALSECGYGCSVVLTFEGCAAYAADATAAGTAVGWGESNTSRNEAGRAALSECGLRGGSDCRVVVLGCNGPVSDQGLRDRVGDAASPSAEAVEAVLGLDGLARRAIQRGLAVSGVDPGAPDGMFGPGTRGALRRWQASRGLAATGYLDGASALVLQAAGLRSPTGASGAGGPAFGAVVDPTRGPGDVFQDCEVCPEMVVLPGSVLALGRYEVTVEEYRAFASATEDGAGRCNEPWHDYVITWRAPGFPQTDRHPVTCVSWEDAQEYVSWLNRTTSAGYRLPTHDEWKRAAAGSQIGCNVDRTGHRGTCPVGSYGSNAVGLSDMGGNVNEWTEECWGDDCGTRIMLGASWRSSGPQPDPGMLHTERTTGRSREYGFRVLRTLD